MTDRKVLMLGVLGAIGIAGIVSGARRDLGAPKGEEWVPPHADRGPSVVEDLMSFVLANVAVGLAVAATPSMIGEAKAVLSP